MIGRWGASRRVARSTVPRVDDGRRTGVRPLAGIRVLDVTTFLSGPVAARTLADLGAEVIRVEPPRGDPTRAGGMLRRGDPPSDFYLALHRDRRAIVLDLKCDAGREVLLALVRRSDVLLENFRPGVAARLGLGPDALAAANPRVVSCSITGFGPDGPAARQSATDGAVQAFAGVLELTAAPGELGLPLPLPVADLVAGATAAQAVLAALVARERAGGDRPEARGTHIDVSMLEALLGWLLVGDRERTLAPPATLRVVTSDGVELLVQTVLHFQPRLAELLASVPGCAGLTSDARFATAASRLEHRDAYETVVRRAFVTRSSKEWLQVLHEIGIPAAPVQHIDDALAHDQLAHRDAVVGIDVPGLGRRRVLASPFRFDGRRKTETAPPPSLGEHTAVVLREVLDCSAAELAALASRGAFGSFAIDVPVDAAIDDTIDGAR
jgi:crotonobetainyl-CoA:carnitine CoA-transferase CaiB-like acyl-CoA transferase